MTIKTPTEVSTLAVAISRSDSSRTISIGIQYLWGDIRKLRSRFKSEQCRFTRPGWFRLTIKANAGVGSRAVLDPLRLPGVGHLVEGLIAEFLA
jgi:hypothetical protein